MATSAPFTLPAQAAIKTIKVRFEGDQTDTAVVEGNDTSVMIEKLTGYVTAEIPFAVYEQNGAPIDPATQKMIQYIPPGTLQKNGQFVALKGSSGAAAGAAGLSTYTIKGQFYALLAEGEAVETWPKTTATNPYTNPATIVDIDPAGSALAAVVSTQERGITVDSKIKLKVLTDETASGSMNCAIMAGSGTGKFVGYNTVDAVSVTKVGNNKVMNVRISARDANGNTMPNTSSMSFQITPMQKHSVVDDWVEVPVGSGDWKPVINKDPSSLILANTVYDIEFLMPTSNELLLRVVSPQYLTDEIATRVGGTNTALDYIKLGQDDTLDWISQDFKLITEAGAYGAIANIAWKWDPVNPNHKSVVEVKEGRSPVAAKINQQEDDVKGSMVATVTYQGKYNDVGRPATSTARVDVVIKGKGKPPFVHIRDKTIGTDPPVAIGVQDSGNPIGDNLANMPNRMDVYDGRVIGFQGPNGPKYPWRTTGVINMGEKNAAAEYIIINSSSPEAVELYIDTSLVPYKFGDKITNPAPRGQGSADMIVRAKTGGLNTTLTFEFYGKGNGGVIQNYQTLRSPNITVEDTTPSKDATLKLLDVRSDQLPGDYVIDFGFVSTKTQYDVPVPYAAEKVKINPVTNDKRSTVVISVGATEYRPGEEISLVVGETKKVEILVTAQDTSSTQTYILNISRQAKSTDSSLKSLKIFSEEGSDAPDLLVGFDPAVTSYDITVPYSVKRVRAQAETNSRWATLKIEPAPMRAFFLFTTDWIALGHEDDPNKPSPNPTPIIATVTAEEDTLKTAYTVNVRRDDPSENNRLSELAVKNAKGEVLPYNDGQVFAPTSTDYYIDIPYSTTELRFAAKPEQEYAESITLTDQNGNKIDTKAYNRKTGNAVEFRGIKIPVDKYPGVFTFKLYATAESGRPTTADAAANDPDDRYLLYSIEFTRNPPDTDTRLETLELSDQDGKAVEEFAFNTEQLTYDVQVPYATAQVKVLPKAKSKLSTVKVNGQEMTENRPFLMVPLTPNKITTVTVVVTAENGDTRTYTINLLRTLPSTETRLESLVVNGGKDFKPRFIPNTTAYSVTIPEGTKGYTITAVTVDKAATLQIDGKKAESGAPSATITPVEEVTKVIVKVTAQDGKTVREYIITVTDENLMVKSSNADLASLKVNYGDMWPRFKPAVLDYSVAVKTDTFSVDILPKPANKNATVEVFAGTKKLGDYNDNYSSALIDDENEFRVKVTAQDTTVKEYNITVSRNNEDMQGNLKPITADMVNYEQESPIVVDITKYTIVSAEVINKMLEYPDKSILFKGNDYTLEMKGKDFKELVPNTESFDFSLSYTSPEEDAIWSLIEESDRNDRLEPVFVYFSHHGKLPAPMKFTLSLGHEYRNETLYWNYYNEERDRIDYYGYVRSNAKGTFTVPLTHMSTYIVTEHPIIGAENKFGLEPGFGDNLSTSVNGDKGNPNTGEGNEQ